MTFASVAVKAGVSRSWLYTQSDLRKDITRLRNENQPDGPPIRTRDRASADSLHARLAAAQDRIQTLAEENTQLRHQLALALGRARCQRDGVVRRTSVERPSK